VLRQVQPIYGMSHLLNEAVVAKARSGDQVFDVGTSCGIHGILTTRT
jgi:release factor glutamine methyltransferase